MSKPYPSMQHYRNVATVHLAAAALLLVLAFGLWTFGKLTRSERSPAVPPGIELRVTFYPHD